MKLSEKHNTVYKLYNVSYGIWYVGYFKIKRDLTMLNELLLVGRAYSNRGVFMQKILANSIRKYERVRERTRQKKRRVFTPKIF